MIRVFLLLVSFLFAKEIVVTKYLEQRPDIGVFISAPKGVEKIIHMDFTVLDHFNVFYNKTKPYTFKFSFNKNKLKVIYKKNNRIFKTKIYISNSSKYFPFLVHKAIYDINKFFNFKGGEFLTRKIVYSVLTAPKEASIYLADYTLSYKKLLINGGLNVFPKWANKEQTAIYFTKYQRMPVLYKYNIYTGKLKKILTSPGLLIVSDVSKRGLLLTLALKDNPDVYLYKNKKLIQITTYPGIDVNGKFFGDKIAFISNRYGMPLVFVKDLQTGLISRVLYHGKNQVGMDTFNDKMVISSRETNKAFSPNTFNLFLVNKDDDSLRRLTLKGQNMFPNFSIDGNSIMFIKRENFYSKIGIIRLNENKIFYYKLNKRLQSFDW